MSRDQRRAQLKEIFKEYERVGFNPANIPTVFGLVRELTDILSDKSNPKRLTDAADHMMKVYEACAKKHSKPNEVACKKGCGFCCHTRVSVTAAEVFLLARFVKEKWKEPNDASREDFEAREAAARGLNADQRVRGRVACPLMIDNSCSVYMARPLPCRAYASTSLDKCLELYNQFVNNVPHPNINQLMRTVIFAALHASLALAGLSNQSYEMGHALTIATGRGAEARWLAGEPIFENVWHEVRLPERKQGNETFDLLVQMCMNGPYGKDVPENQWFKWRA